VAEGAHATADGIPDDFDLTPAQAEALGIDALLASVSLDETRGESGRRLATARNEADERGDRVVGDALQLLVLALDMSPSDLRRTPFDWGTSGTRGDGSAFRRPLPGDFTDRHAAVLNTLLAAIQTPILRGRIADVLWHRPGRRNPFHARVAVQAYLDVADATFDPVNWLQTDWNVQRALRIASLLGTDKPEYAAVVATAQRLLARLEAGDPGFLTVRLISHVFDSFNDEQASELFGRVRSVAERSVAGRDFHRARRYYESAIALAGRLGKAEDVKALRIARAETHIGEADDEPNETQRAVYLREARDALLDANASREQREHVDRLLAVAQRLAVNEMARIEVPLLAGNVPEQVADLLHDREPIDGVWLLADIVPLMSYKDVRRIAERDVSTPRFPLSLARRNISADGREQGQTSAWFGEGRGDFDDAVRGAMRDRARIGRAAIIINAVEPGREQLVLQHAYSLSVIIDALRDRPFIPRGHLLLWSKGIHAGLVGEYDVAVHMLAPQLENALREVLHSRGEVIYTTRNGVQSLRSLTDVLDDPLTKTIFGDDVLFALETGLADRLGANVRNDVAHGWINDHSASQFDAAFVWWLALHMLRFYGRDALRGSVSPEPASV
jgi:hypothetical protein